METNYTPKELNGKGLDGFTDAPRNEVLERRDRNTKHFDLGRGRYQAIIYPQAVHYQQDGAWQEIDNRLHIATDAQGETCFRNNGSSLGVTLAESADASSLVTLTDGTHSIHWKLLDAQSAVCMQPGTELTMQESIEAQEIAAQTDAPSSAQQGETPEETIDPLPTEPEEEPRSLTELPNQNSSVEYPDALPGATLRVAISGEMLKDELVLAGPDSCRDFAFELVAEGMTLAEHPDGMALLGADGEAVYVLPHPRAWDAAEEPRDIAVSMSAEPVDSGAWHIAYSVADDALEDAVWPVTVDPAVRLNPSSGYTVETTYTNKDYPSTNYRTAASMIALMNSGDECIPYIKFSNIAISGMDESHTITKAYMAIKLYNEGTSYQACMKAREMLSGWTASTLTWNTRPSASALGKYIDYVYWYPNGGIWSWDITNHFRNWYKTPGANFGVRLESDKKVRLFSGASGVAADDRPYLVVNYVSGAGYEGWWPYDSMSAGRAGTVSVNLFNGNVVASHSDTACTGNRMPVSVSHYYNSCRKSVSLGCGYGWRLSVHQSLHKAQLSTKLTADLEPEQAQTWYIYTDGDGTEHYFKRVGSTSEWKDTSGMKLTLKELTDTCTITSEKDSVMTFPKPASMNAKTWITRVDDSNGNNVKMHYDANNRITSVVDGVQRTTSFTYNASGQMTKITDPVGREYLYSYLYGCLSNITYPDTYTEVVNGVEVVKNAKSVYVYSGNLLTAFQSYNGKRVRVTYEAADGTKPRRALSFEELGMNGDGDVIMQRGAKRNYRYGDCVTRVQLVESLTADDGKLITYQFNDMGNVVSIKDELGFASFTRFDAGSAPNNPTEVSKLQRVVVNRLSNHNFEAETGWTSVVSVGLRPDDSLLYTTAKKYIGAHSLRIDKTEYSSLIAASQTQTLGRGSTYTLSAWAMVEGLTGTLSSGGAYVSATYYDASGAQRTVKSPALLANSAWQRLQVAFTIPSDATSASVTAKLCFDGSDGKAYFDCVQLEDGPTASRYNILENPCFTRKDSSDQPIGWAKNHSWAQGDEVVDVPAGDDLPAFLPHKALRIAGNTGDTKYYSQTLNISGRKGDCYVFGGWGSACSVPTDGKADRFDIRLDFVGSVDDGSDTANVIFNNEWVNWQFAAGAAVAKEDYSRIRVYVDYKENINEAMFTGLMLYKELFGQTYTYDEDGHVTTSRDLASKDAEIDYDDAHNVKLITQTWPGSTDNAKYTFNYGTTAAQQKKHNLLSATTPLAIQRVFTYDIHGNVETVKHKKKDSSTLVIGAKLTYRGNYEPDATAAQKAVRGNYVLKTTDADNTETVYTYDDASGQLSKIKDANNNYLHYAYQAETNRVTRVGNHVSGAGAANEYVYEKDRMVRIQHNTTGTASDVAFETAYDDLGLPTQTKVGNPTSAAGMDTLSTITYSNDRKRRVERVESANGGKVHYRYDDFDRLIGVRHDDAAADRFTYEYGTNGALARLTDHALNRAVYTDYDLAGQLAEDRLYENGELLARSTLERNNKNLPSKLTQWIKPTGGTAVERSQSYTYDKDNRVTAIDLGGAGRNIGYTYDAIGRLTKRTLGNLAAGEVTYTYKAPTSTTNNVVGSTTLPRVATITQAGDNFAYTYDTVGRLTQVTRTSASGTGTKATGYVYDGLSQLIRVNDQEANETWVYAYDNGGNITSKKCHAYTTNADPGTVQETVGYAYGNANWKDQMTRYGTKSVAYDAIGNPTSYDGWTYGWTQGRKLRTAAKGVDTYTFDYDHTGLMTRRKLVRTSPAASYTRELIWKGGQLTLMRLPSGKQLHFVYSGGAPLGVWYDNGYYSYRLNLQGDVIELIAADGSVAQRYHYDAWGRPLDITTTTANTIGADNPLRYRGYYWDPELEMYYLRSRWYRPEWGRFLNADSGMFRPLCLLANNLYGYCSNRPVTSKDIDGCAPHDLFDSPDEAFVDFAEYSRTLEFIDTFEYGMYLCDTEAFDDSAAASVQFWYTLPHTDYSIDSVNVDTAYMGSVYEDDWFSAVGGIGHTHPYYPEYDGEYFSGEMPWHNPLSGDFAVSRATGIPIYLLTPEKKMYVYYNGIKEELYWGLKYVGKGKKKIKKKVLKRRAVDYRTMPRGGGGASGYGNGNRSYNTITCS